MKLVTSPTQIQHGKFYLSYNNGANGTYKSICPLSIIICATTEIFNNLILGEQVGRILGHMVFCIFRDDYLPLMETDLPLELGEGDILNIDFKGEMLYNEIYELSDQEVLDHIHIPRI